MTAIRTYKLNHYSNQTKINKVLEILRLYRKTAKEIANIQWNLFFTEGWFDKNNNKIKSLNHELL